MHLLLLLPGLVWGHGAVVHPPPRNRVGKLTKIGSRVEKECIKSFKSLEDLVPTRLTAGSHPGPDQCPTLSRELMHGLLVKLLLFLQFLLSN